jgi:septum formation protein
VASQHPKDLVIGSDTVIEIKGRPLGKPENMKEAEKMLRQLRGQCHHVHTGVAIIQRGTNSSINFVETAQVWIKLFEENSLKSYLATEESLGKAGAYSIQGEGAQLIEKIEGDYPTIVGLPLWRTAKALEHQGIVLPNPLEEIYRVKPYANWKDFG